MHGTMLLGGCYEIGQQLGVGGMAEVREGWDHRQHRPVAIKLMHPQFSAQPDLRARFRAEGAIAASLVHPNVVAVYDSGEQNGVPFIVMERLPGGSLADQIGCGPVAEACVRMMLNDTLAALVAAHGHDIVHRDIKPGNIFHTADGLAYKVGDFGLAKTPGTALTTAGQVFGTIAYQSPERLCGAPASVADDLYATGVVGYEALAGRRAYAHDDNLGALTHAVLRGDRVPLGVLRPDVDPWLVAVIERAMAHDPRQRYKSAAEMRTALGFRPAQTKVFGVSSGPPLPPSAVPSAPAPRPGRAGWWILAAATLAVFAVTILALLLDAVSSKPAEPAGVTMPVATTAPAVQSPVDEPPAAAPPADERPHGAEHGKKGHGRGKGPHG